MISDDGVLCEVVPERGVYCVRIAVGDSEAVLTPDQADELAERLRRTAAHERLMEGTEACCPSCDCRAVDGIDGDAEVGMDGGRPYIMLRGSNFTPPIGVGNGPHEGEEWSILTVTLDESSARELGESLTRMDMRRRPRCEDCDKERDCQFECPKEGEL